MNYPLLVARNTFRNRLRTILAVAGMAVAVFAFLFLRTALDQFKAGEQHARQDRMVVRNKVSFTVEMPLSYKDKIAKVPGIAALTWAQWFGGKWGTDRSAFFARFAVDPSTYFKVSPEMVLPPAAMKRWLADRQGCVIGQELADTYHFKVGDIIPIKGDIFPGDWKFTVDGIFKSSDPGESDKFMLLQYDYLNQALPSERQNQIGSFWIRIAPGYNSAEVGRHIDAMFANSPWETKTESERAFQLGFLSMISEILDAVSIISFVILLIITLVLANAIAMSVRERTREYAVLRCVGFRPRHLLMFILGEGLLTAVLGGAVGVAVSLPIIHGMEPMLRKSANFAAFAVQRPTLLAALGLVVAIGALASLVPAVRAARLNIITALRKVA